MWINSNVVRKSPFLSPGQAVQRYFAVGKIEVHLAVVLTQRCFLWAFALWCNELLTIEKGDFQRTDGINMNFYGVKVTNLFWYFGLLVDRIYQIGYFNRLFLGK